MLNRLLLLIFFLVMLLVGSEISSQELSTDWWVTDGEVKDVTFSSTHAFVVGDFDYVGPSTGKGNVVGTASGKVATLFARPNGEVSAVVSDGSGGWYIGGNFDQIDGASINNLAHLNSDGSLDASWSPNPNGLVTDLLLNGTDLYVAGAFGQIQGETRQRVAKLEASTASLSTWDAGSIGGTVEAMVLEGAYLYVGGGFTGGVMVSTPRLARISIVDASVDTGWDPSPTSTVYALASDGTHLFVGGEFNQIEGVTQEELAKLLISDHSLQSWDPDPNNTIRTLCLDGSDLFIGGQFTSVGTDSRRAVAKVNAVSGTIDSWDAALTGSFGQGVQALAVDGDDLYVGGNYRQGSNSFVGRLLKFDKNDASLSSSWLPKPTDEVTALAVSGTTLYAGGDFTSLGGLETSNVAKLDLSTGQADENFSISMNAGSVANCVIIQGDIFVGGTFTSVNGDGTRDKLVRLDQSNGSLASWSPSMSTSFSAATNALTILNDSIYVAGTSLTLIGGQSVQNIGRISLTSGDGDPSWKPEVSGNIIDMEFEGADLYIGGSFSDIDNSGVSSGISRLAKLNANDDLVDASWSPNPTSGQVNDIVIFGSEMFVGGTFSTIDAVSRNRIAKLDLSTGNVTDPSWNANLSGSSVNSILARGNELYVGGNFTQVGGVAQTDLARLHVSDASLDMTWAPAVGGSLINVIRYGSDGPLIGGLFTSIDNQPFSYLSYTDSQTPLPVELAEFSGLRKQGEVVLKWSTALEINNAGFDIERSIDQVDFHKVGFVAGAGTSDSQRNYTFVDKSTLPHTTFYRLKQKDLDGKTEYSKVVRVGDEAFTDVLSTSVYPNPTSDKVQLLPRLKVRSYKIIDASGKSIVAHFNDSKDEVDLGFLIPGSYIIEFETEFGIVRKRVTKK